MMDLMLEAWVSASIEKSRAAWVLGRNRPWLRGEKLKLLFAGYNGTRNMGSDVRVQEMLRQIRYILGAENVDFSVMSMNFKFSEGYFEGTRQVHLPDIFHRSWRTRFPGITGWWPAKVPCSRASSPMR